MSIVAHTRPFVIGVDAHARTHSLTVLACPTGELLDEAQFPATAAGLQRAVAWVARRTAQASLPLQQTQLRLPRSDDGPRAALRVLIASRDHITNERTAAINALTALLRALDLDIDFRGTLSTGRIRQIASWRNRAEELSVGVARAEAIRLATRVRAADKELGGVTRQMTALLNSTPAAVLLDKPGIEPVTAAIAYAAWSHPAGSVPKRPSRAWPASTRSRPHPATPCDTASTAAATDVSTAPHHMAALTRMRMDPDTRAYVEKHTTEGRTLREIRRSLKRYLARQIYHHLTAVTSTAAGA